MTRGAATFTVTINCLRCAKHEQHTAEATPNGNVVVNAWAYGREGWLCDHCGVNGWKRLPGGKWEGFDYGLGESE